MWLLAQRLPVSGESVLAAMRRRALTPTVRLWAIRAPFETKEALRARGYRWMPEMRNGIERAWWTDVAPEEEEAELAWPRPGLVPAMGTSRARSSSPRRPLQSPSAVCAMLARVSPTVTPRHGDRPRHWVLFV